MRTSVKEFAKEMERQLGLHQEEKGGKTWPDLPIVDLKRALEAQTQKFKTQFISGDFEGAKRHLIHAANYCMMLHERSEAVRRQGEAR